MPAFCLSIHAGYRCGHSGACCTAGWPIAIGPELAASLGRHEFLSATGGASGRVVGTDFAGEQSFITAVRAADFQLRHTPTHVGPGSLSTLRRD